MAEVLHKRRLRPEIVSEPATSGWSELHKTVRTADINKVDDCRDDIDTLLVFAGLYSAVLTAFVIESYTHLQQDTQDVIVSLLQQIAAQNFTSGPGFLNSTNPSPSLPSFEPPLWAIRVNILWFMSLLLSLSSASFGILVKQWLREYLAIDQSAPRERLRARQYRNPAIASWKVFEIAAFLPLLLQISLGLFFLGLCFFTAAVHNSIGRTTAPLVSAWAFLFLMTTIAPLFSPRCPYKTTFLKRALRIGRCYASPPLRSMLRYVRRRLASGWVNTMKRMSSGWDWYLRVAAHISAGWDRFTDTLGDFVESFASEWAQSAVSVIFIIIFAPVLLPVLLWQYMPSIVSGVRRPFDLWKRSASDAALLEEEHVIKTEEEDNGVLLSVDSIVFDDALLPSMLDTLRQQAGPGSSPEKIVQFIVTIIGHRIGKDLDVPRLTFVPDMHPLSKFAWSTITDVTAELLRHNPGPLVLDINWVFNSVTILLHSPPRYELSEHAITMLQDVRAVPLRTPDHSCSDGVCLSRCLPPRILGSYPDSVVRVPGTRTCLRCLINFYRVLLCQDANHSHPSLNHLLYEHTADDAEPPTTSWKELVCDIFNVLTHFLETVPTREDLTEIHGSHEALHIILQHGKKFGRHVDAVRLCGQVLLTEASTCVALAQFAALYPQCRVSDDAREILWHIFAQSSNAEEKDRIQARLVSACERFCTEVGDEVPLDPVRLCAECVWWTDSVVDLALAEAIEQYHRTQGWREGLRYRNCWYGGTEVPTPEERFKEDQDLACGILKKWWAVPTELKDALWLFVPEERHEEVLHSIRAHRELRFYTPRARTVAEGLAE